MASSKPDFDRSTVLYEVVDHVAHITLNRPNSLNAINRDMQWRLNEIWDDFRRNDEALVGVFTGNGRAFCAGRDLREAAESGRRGEGVREVAEGARAVPIAVHILKPIICAVNGPAAGGGVGYALDCDIILGSPAAEFVVPFVARGLMGGGISVLLARKVGLGAALWLALSAQRINAETALRIGLLHELLPAEELLPRAHYLAERIASYSPVAVRAMKEKLLHTAEVGLAAALRYVGPTEQLLMQGTDPLEGTQAFVEKRRARFKRQAPPTGAPTPPLESEKPGT